MKILFHLHFFVQTKLYWCINTRARMTENGRTKNKQHFVIHNPISGDNITEVFFIMSIIRFKTKAFLFSCWWGWLKRIFGDRIGKFWFPIQYMLWMYIVFKVKMFYRKIYISSVGQVKEYGVSWPDILRICMNIVLKITNNHNNDGPFCRVTYMVSEKMCEGKIECKWMDNGSVGWLVGWLAYRPTRAERHIV